MSDSKANHQHWDNPIDFLMTCVGFAVGLGIFYSYPNPYLVHLILFSSTYKLVAKSWLQKYIYLSCKYAFKYPIYLGFAKS
jgi:hypothetical protein